MRLLDRYVARQVVVYTMLALGALVCIFAFFEFVDEIDDIGEDGYTLSLAIQYTLLTLPRRAFELFPVACLLGALLGLGQLNAGSEITVMRASGISVLRLSVGVMYASIVMGILALVIGEWVSPKAEQQAQVLMSNAMNQKNIRLDNGGFWARGGDDFINVKGLTREGKLSGISIYHFDEKGRIDKVSSSKVGEIKDDKWVLKDITSSTIESTQVVIGNEVEDRWEIGIGRNLLQIVQTKPERIPANLLFRYITYLQENGQDASRYELAMWSKLSYPVASATMILLSIPLVLNRPRDGGAGKRILMGAVVGLSFYVISKFSAHSGLVFGLDPFLSAFMPIFLFMALAMILMRRLW